MLYDNTQFVHSAVSQKALSTVQRQLIPSSVLYEETDEGRGPNHNHTAITRQLEVIVSHPPSPYSAMLPTSSDLLVSPRSLTTLCRSK